LAKIITKEGWLYRGRIVSESETRIVILDKKLNKEIELAKDFCSLISKEEF